MHYSIPNKMKRSEVNSEIMTYVNVRIDEGPVTGVH
jgi:hypothetical protein